MKPRGEAVQGGAVSWASAGMLCWVVKAQF